jgi:hypothetical protein
MCSDNKTACDTGPIPKTEHRIKDRHQGRQAEARNNTAEPIQHVLPWRQRLQAMRRVCCRPMLRFGGDGLVAICAALSPALHRDTQRALKSRGACVKRELLNDLK